MFRRRPLAASRLYDQVDFYRAFERDLRSARRRIVIESPFVTERRCSSLTPSIDHALYREVRVIINTRDPSEHDPFMESQAREAIYSLQNLGVTTLYTTKLHRKIALLDHVAWEGSLNILSQSDSCEIMRRTSNASYAQDLVEFIKMSEWYN